jgi:hypothetical protein
LPSAALPPPAQLQLAVEIISKNPRVLSLSKESMEAVLVVLAECGFSGAQITTMVALGPGILVKAATSIRATVLALRELGYTNEQVLKCPSALAYSIEKRILPRFRFFEACGRTKRRTSCGMVGLSMLLGPVDAKFSESATGDPQAYSAWLARQPS